MQFYQVSKHLLIFLWRRLLTRKSENTAIRMTGEERRLQILQVAIELFAKQGFSGTTTKKIAEEAGVSEAMVFRHFATKKELYHAILDHKACEGMNDLPWEDEAIKAAIEKSDDFTVFNSLACRALHNQQKDTTFMRLLFHSAFEKHELADMFFDGFISQIYEFLSAYISKRQKEGAMRDVNPRIVVRSFLGTLIHHSMNNILWDKKRRLLDISNEEAAKEFTKILLNGIKK